MKKCIYIVLLITSAINTELYSQYQHFMVEKATFCSRINDEFSPVFYKDGIVFCSNKKDNSLISYKDGQNELFKIFYVTKKDSIKWKQPTLLAKEITTSFNDGPITFNAVGNNMYYSRNNFTENHLRNISDTTNKLGIYSAELINGIWTNIQPFTYNNPLYSFCTPALTADGKRIYFSSDMPGGYGGMDLYYCDWSNNKWDQPVNMGSIINTSKNESFPFACKNGKLFFASDGHEGFGGKDIFYTQEINDKWTVPAHLDSAINSTADDFGLVTDSTFENGYFSTNRLKTDDIFSFSTASIDFSNCDSLRENNYCFTLYDEQNIINDTISAIYKWNFGDSIIRTGKEVKHCFPGSGKYSVKLNIIDALTGKAIAEQIEYKIELEDILQAYINSSNVGIINKPIYFDGLKTNLKESKITDYYWNFGDGYKLGESITSKTFKKEGEYIVHLGILTEKDSLGIKQKKCVTKKIKVLSHVQELKLVDKKNQKADSIMSQNQTVQIRIYISDDIPEPQKSKIKKALVEQARANINFDQYGIKPNSYPFLNVIVGILKENSDIKLELTLYTTNNKLPKSKMETSEQWAQELTFYFKNNEVDLTSLHSKGIGLSSLAFKQIVSGSIATDGVVEFIFIKK